MEDEATDEGHSSATIARKHSASNTNSPIIVCLHKYDLLPELWIANRFADGAT